MNWLLFLIIIIILGSAIRGYQRGLIKTVFALISLVITLLVSSVVSPQVSRVLQKNEYVRGKVTEALEKVITFDEEKELEKTSDETNYIETMKLPQCIKTTLLENNHKEVYKTLAVNSFEEYVIQIMTIVVINAIAYIACFVIAIILLLVLCQVLHIISKLPLLNEINKAAGLVTGLISGVVKVWIFFVVLTLFSTTEAGIRIFEMVNKSPLLTFMYENNLLIKWITNITGTIF